MMDSELGEALGTITDRLDGIDGRLANIEKDLHETRKILDIDARVANLKTLRSEPRSGSSSTLPLAAKSNDTT